MTYFDERLTPAPDTGDGVGGAVPHVDGSGVTILPPNTTGMGEPIAFPDSSGDVEPKCDSHDGYMNLHLGESTRPLS